MSENYGMAVKVWHTQAGLTQTFRNVTEIDWHYPSVLGEHRVAFESDWHGTGSTYGIDDIERFETDMEYELAEESCQKGIYHVTKSSE